MALAKEGYIVAQRGTTRQQVLTNANGDLADETDTIKGYKYLTINMANADNSLTDNTELIAKFLSFIGIKNTTDPYTNQMTVKWEVA